MEMEMEMEMRAGEDVDIGEDVTPPLFPLSFALYDSFLLSHCSSCFSTLPDYTPAFSSNSCHVPSPSPLYCSPQCYDHSGSTLPLPSSTSPLPTQTHTSDLRASLRLLHLLQFHPYAWHAGPPERIFGLLTNREKLIPSSPENSNDDDEELLATIRDGAQALAMARRKKASVDAGNGVVLEEAILCLVMTNAVEVQDSTGCTLGIAVYDPGFCWINHSCSPNSSYRFLVSPPSLTASYSSETKLRIFPGCHNSNAIKRESSQVEKVGVCSSNLCSIMTKYASFGLKLDEKWQNCGPRVVVRSTKKIRKGEEVTVTYTDLLQPKATRQSELWSRYRFFCSCHRCSESPLSYVDHALQEISVLNPELTGSTSSTRLYYDNAIRSLTDYTDCIITEYLSSSGDSESCCHKLENMLTFGFFNEQLDEKEVKQLPTFRLSPLHHLSLNSYTTLASAYKVRSRDFLSVQYPEKNEHLFKAFEMSKTSAAYYLLLACATHHLFHSEPSLIASAATYWTSAGESILALANSSVWIKVVKQGSPYMNHSSFPERVCSTCSWIDYCNASSLHSQAFSRVDMWDVYKEFTSCVANISHNCWSFLARNCQYLRLFKNPFDFKEAYAYSGALDPEACCSYNNQDNELTGYSDQGRISIFCLGVHCLLYGRYLSIIC